MKQLLIILFLFTSALSVLGIFTLNKNTIKKQLEHTTQTYNRAYNTVYSEKFQLATTLSSGLTKMGKLKKRLSKLSSVNDQQKDKIRQDIYNDLLFRYSKLKEIGIKQIHISLPNNISFLKMSQPNHYGEDLTNIRPSIRYINKYKKPTHSIELGNISYGARFIYPIFNNGVHVGNLGLTFDFYTITASIMKQYDVLSNFFIKLNKVQEAFVKTNITTYKKSQHQGYYLDRLVLQEIKKASKKELINLIPQKSISNKILFAGKKYKPSSIYDKQFNFIITVIPIINKITKNNIAFLTVRSQAEHTILSDTYIYIIILLTISFLSIGFYLLYILLTKNNELQNILDSQTNFILLTDGKKIKSVNKALLNFFDYPSLIEFNKEHSCICDFFIEEDGYLRKKDGESWLDEMLIDSKKLHQVKMKDKYGDVHFFQIDTNINNITNDNYVITFTNITELEEKKQEAFTQKQQMIERTKSAQMGEMIGNIAHQWRQPLSVISTTSTGMLMQKEYGILDDDTLIKSCNSINENAQFLSETINTFTNYIKEKKELKEVILQDRINSTIEIISASLKSNQITLINNINECEDIKITMTIGLLSQVIINIINNAKDIQLSKQIKEKWIRIDLKKEKQCAIITIEDHGGGVPNEIIHKIFDPYFTTKHQSQGTGLGLHMSKDIVERTLFGKLTVQNGQNGAIFTISLPL